MVSFSSDIPDIKENYIGWSKEISQPHGDESGRILGQTIGEAITEGGKLYDQHQKSNADNEAHQEMDKLQDDRLEQLNTMYSALGGKTVDADGNPTQGPSLLNKPEGDYTPENLKNLQVVADNLRQGKRSGVYDDNYYQMRKDETLKRLRSQYPGYRDYIDSKFKDAEGSTANERAQGLIKSINDLLGQKNTEDSKTNTFAQQNYQYPNVFEAHQNWLQNPTPENKLELMKTIATGKAGEHRVNFNKLQLEEADLKGKDTARLAERAFSESADFVVHNNWERINKNSGPFNTGQKAFDAMQEYQSSGELSIPTRDPKTGVVSVEKRAPSQTELNQIQAVMDAATNRTRAELESLGSKRDPVLDANGKPTGEYGKSLRDRLPAGRYAELVKDRMDFQHTMRQQYYDGQGAGINTMKIANEAKIEDGLNGAFKGELGEFSMRMAIAQKIGGPQAVAQVLTNTNTLSDLTKSWKTWANSESFKLITNAPDVRASLTKSIHGVNTTEESPETKAAVVKSLIDVPKIINNPKLTETGKRNIIQTTFDPMRNRDLMKEFGDDLYKDRKLRMGKQSVYKDLLSPNMLKEAYAVGQRDGGKSWNTVKDWAQDTAVGYMIPSAVRDVNEVNEFSQKNPYFKLTYSPESHKLVIDENQSEAAKSFQGRFNASGSMFSKMGPGTGTVYDSVMRDTMRQRLDTAIGRLNDVFGVMSNISKTEGSNPDEYILDTLQKAGMDVSTFGKSVSDVVKRSYKPIPMPPKQVP